MDAIWKAITEANVWQLAIAAIAVVAGSSAVSSWISSGFTSRTASKTFRRDVRSAALTAIGEAYSVYLRYGNATSSRVTDPKRDQEVAEISARMHVRVAAVGDEALLNLSGIFSTTGELFASQNEDTSVVELDDSFTRLVTALANGVPAK